MLQDTWMRIHRVRHTYRAGDPVLPWVYTIARRVRVDNYRKRYRVSSREMGVDVLPEFPAHNDETSSLPLFEELVGGSPREPARGGNHAKQTEPGRGGSHYLFDGRSGEAKGASRLSP